MKDGGEMYLFARSVRIKWGAYPTVVDVNGYDGLYVESVEVLHWWAYPLMWMHTSWRWLLDFIQYFADLENRRNYE